MVIHLHHVGIVTSVTVNILCFLYFAIYISMEKVLSRWSRRSMEFTDFHKNNAALFRITYLDAAVSLALPILAIVVTFTSGILTDRYKTSESQIQIAFSVTLGVFIFMLATNILVKSQNRSVDVVYNIVAIAAFIVALGIQEEPFIGLIIMSSQGSRLTNQLQRLMKKYWKTEKPFCYSGYGIVVFTNAVFTVGFNGLIPLLYLISTVMQTYSMKSQLSSLSIGFFYAFLVFYSFMNGWALCAVTDESKQYLNRNKKPPSYRVSTRSPGRTLRIASIGQAQGGRPTDVHFPALPNEILPPPSYSQVLKDTQQILTTSCEKNPVVLEKDFVTIRLQTP